MADQKPKAPLKGAAKVEQPKVEQPKVRSFKTAPNVGLLIHPFTQVHFTGAAVEVDDVDFWVINQLDAGKLVEC